MFDKKDEFEKLLLLIVAERAARRAGEVLLKAFGTQKELTTSVGVLSRSPISSVYDKVSNEIIIKSLLEEYFYYEKRQTKIGVLSEEIGVAIAEKKGSNEWIYKILGEKATLPDEIKCCWVIDPLCGSIPYARGVADFVVSICFMEGKKQKLGIVYDPVRDECFSAIKGMGAFVNGKPIQPSMMDIKRRKNFHVKDFKKTYISIEHKVFREADAIKIQNFCNKVGRIRVAGTCGLELCYVACGRVDALIKIKQPLYDYAAGLLILSESLSKAGRRRGVTDLQGKSLNVPTINKDQNTDILATNGIIDEKLINITKDWM